MDYNTASARPQELASDCIIVGVHESAELSSSAKALDQAAQGYISQILARGDLKGANGQSLLLHDLPSVRAPRVLLMGCGQRDKFNDRRFCEAVTNAALALKGCGAAQVASFLGELAAGDRDSYRMARMTVETWDAANYRYETTKSKKKTPEGPEVLTVATHNGADAESVRTGVLDASAIAAGSRLARELGNLPGNICTPEYLAEQARALADGHAALETTVLEESDMQALGMGALLSVSRGSRQPARLIVMHYRGGEASQPPVVFVGKGLTFDAGGISLKPAAEMDEMKFDMCGGASVLGTMKACTQLDLAMNVVGIVPASENLPDGEANKPGDIVTSMSGQTIEILNTDAEGRLLLCDALTYSRRFDPEIVVDIATLTGACVIALGHQASGVMGNDDGLVGEILAAGEATRDRAWQLPLWEEYQEQLDSNFADMANIGGRPGGSITAACFLSRYTSDLRWAHLDIAGTAWKTGKAKGATGRPVALLTQLLLNRR
jgi:leucyl aminopeptidase